MKFIFWKRLFAGKRLLVLLYKKFVCIGETAMFRKFFATQSDFALFILRITLGGVMLPHGLQKSIGAFGGLGFQGTMNTFESMHLPSYLAVMIILAESLGALFLIFGFFTRLAGFGIACVMAGAIALVHWNNGFFMNWFNTQSGEGFEYHLLAFSIGFALMMRGGGLWSLDARMAGTKS